jgi:type I restriction enzyme R subunit
MDETIIEIIISEAQNEVADFRKWGFDIIPHRARDEAGLRDRRRQAYGCRIGVQEPEHPFRVAIVCAMWLTGFDVECLATLYIDKPMRAHTLMQAIARANRRVSRQGLRPDRRLQRHAQEPARSPGTVCARDDGGDDEIVAPLEERVSALADAIELPRRTCAAGL